MSNLAYQQPAQIFGDILTTTNNGAGLPVSVPAQLQDGLGNPSPVFISQNTFNVLNLPPYNFQIQGTNITALASSINALCGQFPGLSGDTGLVIPVGTTASRPVIVVQGMLRYNTDISSLEIYVNGAWRNA